MATSELLIRRRRTASPFVLAAAVVGFAAAFLSFERRTLADDRTPVATPPTESPTGRRFGLLVGVSKYDRLATKYQLVGPVHDVELFRGLLVDSFDFPASDIRVLAETDGACGRPTADNIRGEFNRLQQQVRTGDLVFILLNGHGSQQPDTSRDPVHDPEPDGFDEVFLPCDVAQWNDVSGVVDNAIIDDEIRECVSILAGKGAFVFLVADSCCSGTLTRGPESAEATRSDGTYLVRSNLV